MFHKKVQFVKRILAFFADVKECPVERSLVYHQRFRFRTIDPTRDDFVLKNGSTTTFQGRD